MVGGWLMTILSSLGSTSCKASGLFSELDRTTGSSRVPVTKILDLVMVKAGSLFMVSLSTSDGSGGSILENSLGVPRVLK